MQNINPSLVAEKHYNILKEKLYSLGNKEGRYPATLIVINQCLRHYEHFIGNGNFLKSTEISYKLFRN